MSPRPGAGPDQATAHALPPFAGAPDLGCYDTNPEVFFPKPGANADEALDICGRCTHRIECRDWAVDTGQRFGIWGATTPTQRRILAAQRHFRRTA